MNQDIEQLELTLVASLLAQPSLIAQHRLAPTALTNPFAARVLATMQKLDFSGQRVFEGSLLLASAANDREDIKKLRAVDIETDPGPLVAHLRRHAQARELGSVARTIGKLAATGEVEAAKEVLGRALLAQETGDVAMPVLTFRELILKTVETIKTQGVDAKAQIRLGMDVLDGSYRLSPGSMLVIGAQTNVGKTSVVMTWLMSIARRATPVGIVSVEDADEDYGAKAIGDLAAINPSRMWAGKLTEEEWRVCIERSMRHADLPIHYTHVSSRRLDEVLARIEYMARVRGVRVVAVDYLQAIAHRHGGKDIRERIDNTLEELISICGRLGVALILASQLARPDKGSPFREPQLIDLKESGSIENRAQCVVMLWREDDKPNSPVKAKIAKAKRQPAGVRFALRRDPDTGMLVDERTLSTFGGAGDPGPTDADAYAVGGWKGRT